MPTLPSTCHHAYRRDPANERARDTGPSMATRLFSKRPVVEARRWALTFPATISDTWTLIGIVKTSGALRWTPPDSATAIAVRVIPGTVRCRMLQGMATTTMDVEEMFGIAVPAS